MNRRKFVVVSTVMMAVLAAAVAGMALYSSYVVKASIPALPEALAWLPADTQAVFGMNVQKFVASPIYARFEERHGRDIAHDLGEFTARTGVDPRRDISYVVGAGRVLDGPKGEGVAIAVGHFNTTAITTFIQTHGSPVKVDYKGVSILMIPENSDYKVDKGIAFIGESEIALGELESLKQVLDVRSGSASGIMTSGTLGPMLRALNPDEMFWFAGDAARIVAKAPANTPFAETASALLTVSGALNLTDAVTGKITATARDEDSARKLADVARGAVALGQLAGESHPEVAELLTGINVTQEKNDIRLVVNFPMELLDRLGQAKPIGIPVGINVVEAARGLSTDKPAPQPSGPK